MPHNATLLIIVSIIIVSRVPRNVFFYTLTIATVSQAARTQQRQETLLTCI